MKWGNYIYMQKLTIPQIRHLQQTETREASGYVNKRGEYILLGFNGEHRKARKVRKFYKKLGAIATWHTHPSLLRALSTYSGLDIVYTYCSNLPMEIFCDEGILVVIPLRRLPIKEILELDKKAWEIASTYEEYDEPYFVWKGLLEKYLPVKSYWKVRW
jgi:hypothetical protein